MKVIILTCDKYAWIVPFCLYFYRKNWPDNPYKTEIITESNYIGGKVFYTTYAPWSSGILRYLAESEEDKFMLIQEDFLIKSPVDTARIKEAESLCTGNVGHVRMNNAPTKYFNRHSINSDVKGFREYPLSQRFAMTTQIAICQKDFLFDALKAGETAWETERNGAKRVAKLAHKWKALWPKSCIADYHWGGLMRKGHLRPAVLRWIKPELLKSTSIEAKMLYALIQGKIEERC